MNISFLYPNFNFVIIMKYIPKDKYFRRLFFSQKKNNVAKNNTKAELYWD